ncbi:hypothetical protein [Facilibium subflavum]|uniref:hypothetical protein n=1 Tax=Facilibium subflavum TaxID=2219058 RepID=UPI000E65AF29|nr:hypothetical protein [Facilibium subflavum]
MKKRILYITMVILSTTTYSAFAANSGNSQQGTTSVVIEEKHILGDLKMEDKITVTADMIAQATTQKFKIASFCTYTNRKDGKVDVKITTNEGKFAIVGAEGQGEIDYSLSIGDQTMQYGDNTITVDANDSSSGCKTVETVYMTLDADSIKSALAGNYDASFNIAIK